MGSLNSVSGLNKVGVDYRPDVGGVGQQPAEVGNPGGQQQVEGEMPAPTDTKSLVQQLDVLLLNAARKSVSVDMVADTKEVGSFLKRQGAIGKSDMKALNAAAEDAARKLKALDGFSGRDLAMALVTRSSGESDWVKYSDGDLTPAAKALKEAIDAQDALSDRLWEVNSKVEEQFAGEEGGDIREAVQELIIRCDRRSTEIQSVVSRMQDLLQKEAVEGRNVDGRVTSLLSAKFEELLPREALLMHGTSEAVELMNRKFDDALRPLAKKLDEFSSSHSTELGQSRIEELNTAMSTMRNAVAYVKRNGIEVGEGRLEVDRTLLLAMEKALEEAGEKIANAKKTAVENIRTSFIEDARANFSYRDNADLMFKLSAPGNENAQKMKKGLERAEKISDEFLKALSDFGSGRISAGKLDKKVKSLSKAFDKIGLYTSDLVDLGMTSTAGRKVLQPFRSMNIVKENFKELVRNGDRYVIGKGSALLTAGDVRRIMLGEASVSSVVEALARGYKAEDAFAGVDDANIADSEKLGSGGAGTTYKTTLKNGVKLVFKPELEGRIGLSGLALGAGHSYVDSQNTAMLSLATQETAGVLGIGGIVVKCCVGSHDGQFGTFMELANGKTGEKLRKHQMGDRLVELGAGNVGGLPPREVSRAREAGVKLRNKVRGDIARQLNQLEWLDIITGQGDRHWENYFVDINPRKGYEVNVKAIDNDASFSQDRIGMQKYRLDEEKSERFRGALVQICMDLYGDDPSVYEPEYLRCIENTEAIVESDDGSLTIDITKIGSSHEIGMAAKATLGMQTLAVPEVIDRRVHRSLMDLDQNPSKKADFFATIAPRMSEEALEAAKLRLEEAIAHAKILEAKGKVVYAEDWGRKETIDGLARVGKSVEITRANGEKIIVGSGAGAKYQSDYAEGYGLLLAPSYFVRDELDRAFRLMTD